MNNYSAMTVNELLEDCQFLAAEGFGEHKILISRDDEGNGFHALHYTFTTDLGDIEKCRPVFDDTDAPGNIVLLG